MFKGPSDQFGVTHDGRWQYLIDKQREHVPIDYLRSLGTIERLPIAADPRRLDVPKRPHHIDQMRVEHLTNLWNYKCR